MPEYPVTDPHDGGLLDVGDGQHIHWEVRGAPDGQPAVVLHGGPGSGCPPGSARFFDPERFRIVLFDQRGCGRSTPHAADPATDLSANTTPHLIGDIETLRAHLRIDSWLVFGGSWGSTLGLAYAQRRPERVTAIVLYSIVTTTRREVAWVTRDMGRIFPEQWARFRDGAPPAWRDGDLSAGYARLLADPDPAVRERAAAEWCAWEDTHVVAAGEHTPDPRFADPRYRMAFARLVTHYWSKAAFLEDGELLANAGRLAGIPGVLVHGRLDISGPPDVPWHLARRWSGAELVLVDDAGHGFGHMGMSEALVAATDQLAARWAGVR